LGGGRVEIGQVNRNAQEEGSGSEHKGEGNPGALFTGERCATKRGRIK